MSSRPAGTRRHLTPLLSVTQPSLTKPNPLNSAGITDPSAAFITVAGSDSVLLLSLGFRMKSAPLTGAKFCVLSTSNDTGSLRTASPDVKCISTLNASMPLSISSMLPKVYTTPGCGFSSVRDRYVSEPSGLLSENRTGSGSPEGLYTAQSNSVAEDQFVSSLRILLSMMCGVVSSPSASTMTCENTCPLCVPSMPSTESHASISCTPCDITLTASASESVTSNWLGVSV